MFSAVFREESEPRLSRELQRPSLRDTTESKESKLFAENAMNLITLIADRLTGDFHTNKRIIDDIAII